MSRRGRRLALGGGMIALFTLAMAVFVLPFAFPTPPPIVTRFQATQLFSPNDDGRRDVATVSVRMRVGGQVTLELQRDGRTVRTLRDAAPVPAGLVQAEWDGRDDAGRPAPDGRYALKLRARSGERQFNTTRRMTLDTVAPELGGVRVQPTAPGAPGVCRLAVTPTGAGRLSIEAFPYGRSGRPAARLGPRPARAGESVRWRFDGRDRDGAAVAPGLYVLRATLFDAGRNRAAAQGTCWVGRLAGTATPVGPPRARAYGIALRKPGGAALAPSTPTRLVLHERAGVPGRDAGPVLGPRVGRAAAGPAGRVRVRVPPGRRPGELWLVAEAAGGRALIALPPARVAAGGP